MEETPELAGRWIPFSAIESGMLVGMWSVPLAGFEWRDDLREVAPGGKVSPTDPPGPEWWLVPRGSASRRYPVLNKPRLTRDFHALSLDPTRSAILRFAGAYGSLGGGKWLAPRGQTGPSIVFTVGGGAQDFGESLSDWRNESWAFRHFYDLWQVLRTLDQAETRSDRDVTAARSALEQRVTWSDDDAIQVRSEFESGEGSIKSWAWVTHRDLPDHESIIAGLPRKDLRAVGRYHLMNEVNKKLQGSVDPKLLPFRGGTLRFVSENLLSALYLRFALEISEGIGRLKECAGCATPFVPGRRDQRFCGKNCRERDGYRRRAGRRGSERDLRDEVPSG